MMQKWLFKPALALGLSVALLALQPRPALAIDNGGAEAALPVPSQPPAPENPFANLATPVDPPASASMVPDAKGTANGNAGLNAPTPPTESAMPAPPPPSEQPPVPLASIPGKTAPSPIPPAATPSDRNIYDDYREYREQEKERERTEAEFKDRQLFVHEGGEWQIGLDYTRNGFDGYNFNSAPGTSTVFADTQGGNLSIHYFPLHSLTFGRFGIGLVGGVYFTKFETPTTTASNGVRNVDRSTVHSIDTYGARATYEFDYFLGQILVPYVFFGVDQVKVRGYTLNVRNAAGNSETFASYPKSSFTSQYYGGGVHLNLGRIEPTTAARALVSSGIRKFYLTYTATQRSSVVSGVSHFLGLRFEY